MEIAAALRNSSFARLHEGAGVSKTALMYLQDVRKILSHEGRWIKGHRAKDVRNVACRPDDASACEFSLQGALESVREPLSAEWAKAYDLLRKQVGGDLQKWNDRWWRTHKGVLAVVDQEMREAV